MATATSNITSYSSDHSGYALNNASNGYADSTSTSYASINLTRGAGAESYIYWQFNVPTIPTNATINSIVCNYKSRTSSTSTSYIASATIQMYSGTTAKGTAKSILTTSTDASSFSSTEIGTWTAAEINAGVKLKNHAVRGTSRTNNNYYIYFYGADISITYTEAATGNKVYIKVSGTWKEADDVLVKDNGTWTSLGDVYKKVSGTWTKQNDPSAIFDNTKLYISGDNFPSAYTKLQYLESANAQQINTNYIVQETDTIEVDYELTDLTPSGDKFIIGATDATHGGIWVETYNNNNQWYYRFGGTSSSNRAYGNFVSGTFAIKKGYFSVGNTSNSISYASMPEVPLTLFGRTNASNVFKGAYVKISEVRIKNGTDLIHRYVPAMRNSDNELGMLDVIDNVFYTNVGTGTFSYG